VKLALVTETYSPEVNGVAMTLQRLVRGLAARGTEVTVVRPRLKGALAKDPADPAGLAHEFVPSLPLPFYSDLRVGLPVYWRLRKLWRRQRPDVVHIATEGPLGWAALLAARNLGLPVSTSFHTNFQQYMQQYMFRAMHGIAFGYLRAFHNRAACTLTPTAQMKAELEAERFERVGVLTRGVDGVLFNPSHRSETLRSGWGVDADAPVFLYVGRLAVEKNIELAVRAFLRAQAVEPRARFVLVGDGPARCDLEKRYPQFHFAGMRRGEDLAAHYASGDVFLFPSATETFGNVVTEAMASGLAVLCYDYAAGRQHIRTWANGVLAPYGDAEAFVAAAEALMRRRAEWPALRAAARATAEGITWERVFVSFEDTLARVRTGRFAVVA
jgi:glycosyltransferase involved in cell wall biosynthesis